MRNILASLLLACASAYAQSTLSLTFPNGVGIGGNITATMSLSAPAGTSVGPAIMQFTVSTSADITAVTVADTAPTKQVTCTAFHNRFITCIMWGLNANAIAPGAVAAIQLTVSTAPLSLAQTITLTNLSGADGTGTAVALTSMAGSFQILSACNLNNGTTINSTDVILAAKQALGIVSCTNADLDQDGKCTIFDVFREILAAMPVTAGVTGSGICRVGT